MIAPSPSRGVLLLAFTFAASFAAGCGGSNSPQADAPVITAQPQALAVVGGGSGSFSVTATGNGTLSYQWQKDGAALSGKTAATLALTNVQASDAGSYRVAVTNTLEGTTSSTTSSAAVLGVNMAPLIAAQPQALAVVAGGSGSFSVTATGNGTLSYQWQKDGASLAGKTATTLALTNVQVADVGSYAVVVTNTLGGTTTSTASSAAVLGVNVAPIITAQPQALTVAVGGSGSFSVTATGNGTLSYQWQKGGTNLAGMTAATLSLANVQVADAGSYAVVVTNTLGGTTTSTASSAAVLGVNVAPVITAQPQALTVAGGGSGSFSVTASGNGTLSYQWQKDGAALSGKTAATLSLTNVQVADAGSYAVVVTNTLDGTTSSTTSSAAVLGVNVAPLITAQPQALAVVVGGSGSFSVTATGNGTLSYQWQKGGTNLAGMTTATLPLTSVQVADAGSYAVVVTNTLGGTTTSTASSAAVLEVNVAPVITAQPQALTVAAGGSGSFSVTATGNGTLSYQWQKDGAALSGRTAATLSLTNVQAADAGYYGVVVRNTLGGTTTTTASATAALNVNSPPSITTQPLGASVLVGGTATFSVVASGSGTLSYQWQKDGANLAGKTASTMILTNVQAADAGSYRVIVTNTLDGTTSSATSNAAVLGVNVAPLITAQPQALTVVVGGSGSFSVTATGNGTLSYQWQKDGTDLAGKTATTLALTNVQAADAGYYGVVVTNTLGGTTTTTASATAALNIGSPPTITTQPVDTAALVGGTATFSVVASGSGTLSYQWQRDSTDLTGKTASTIILTNVQVADAGSYRVIVTNTLGGTAASATSNAAVLGVNVAPTITAQPQALAVGVGGSGSFAVTATGNGTLSYQWQKGSADLAGKTAATLPLTNVQFADAGNYRVVVTNTLGATTTSATSSAALLTVTVPVTSIAVSPAAVSLPLGRTVQLVAIATYADATTRDVTTQALWASGTPASVTVNSSGMAAPAGGAAQGATSTLTATLDGISGTAGLTLAAARAPIGPTVGNDPLLAQQWHLRNTGQNAYADVGGVAGNDIGPAVTYGWGYTGTGVKVAVVDSGLEIAHEDLAGNVVPGSWNFNTSTNDPTSTAVDGDHGTSVTGLIASIYGNALGGMGVAPSASLNGYNLIDSSQLVSYYLASLGGSASNPTSNDVWVFNQSFGMSNTSDVPVHPSVAAQYASGATTLRGGRGAIYVKSAGNGFNSFSDSADCSEAKLLGISCQNASMDPNNTLPYNIVVGALEASGVKSSYSTAGSAVWVSAPGGEYGLNASVRGGLIPVAYRAAMVTTDQSTCAKGYSVTGSATSSFNQGVAPNTACNYTNTMNGTSSAAPVTSGVVALILEANPTLTWRDVKHILASTSTKVDAAIPAVIDASVTGGPYTAELPWTTNAAGFAFHNWYGFGRVNVDSAVEMAKTYRYGQLGTLTTTPWASSGASLALPIADNTAAGATSSIAMPTALTIEAIQIAVSVTHGYTGDLGIELVSPSGTKSILLNIKNGFGSADLAGMVLESNAFYGEPSAGTWTIRVLDGWAITAGTFNNWQIRVFGH